MRIARDELGAVAACAAFVLFSLNFGAYRVFGDGVEYYSFVQRLFGDRPHGSGYNFGTGLMNAPFYGVAHVIKPAFGSGRIARHLLPASITIASICYVAVAMVLTVWLLRRLRLPARGFAVIAAVFGSPLWYYASLSPSYTHAADSAAFTAAVVCLYCGIHRADGRWYCAAGAALGLEVAVRPYNVAVAVGAFAVLVAARRIRDAVILAVSGSAAYGLLLIVPLVLGTGLRTRVSGATVGAGSGVFGFAPLTPVRMLFTDHRGLFVWTPVTALSVIGYVLLLRSRRDERVFLATLGSMAAALLLAHASLRWWDGGWSFSMRYLASLLPLYAVGLAGLVDRLRGLRRTALVAIATGCVLWSVYLGLGHAFGASQSDGAFEVATRHSAGQFAHLAWSYSRLRHVVAPAP